MSVSKHTDNFQTESTLDHSDLDISTTLASFITDFKTKLDLEELKSLNVENEGLLKENRSLRRQVQREVKNNTPSAATPSGVNHFSLTSDKENALRLTSTTGKKRPSSDEMAVNGEKSTTAKMQKPGLSQK